MKKFENPAMDVEKLDVMDIITTSQPQQCGGNTQLPEEEA